MDTYENKEYNSAQEPEESVTPENDIPQEERAQPDVVVQQEEVVQPEEPGLLTEEMAQGGFYHGAGTGVREETVFRAAPIYGEEEGNAPTMEEQPVAEQKAKPKRAKKMKKFGKRMVAAILILALVGVGSVGSATMMNFYWRHQNRVLQKSFNERISVLQEQLETYRNEKQNPAVVPADGLTPSQIYDQNIKSVVAINCMVRSVVNGQVVDGQSSGSGFVLRADGYVVTNHHVIEDSVSISVITSEGDILPATLVGSDSVNDIALLKVEANDLQPAVIGSSDSLRVGDQVVAIGNALGELSFSLTAGYVSGTDRDVSTDGSMINMIQTDASINSGNSGGPLFNSRGEVVGITTAKYSGTTSSGASIEGIGFAIPMDDVIGMLEDLRQYGYITGAYLGVMVRDVTMEVHQFYGLPLGVYVDSVNVGSCAHRAGIWAKDIIICLGGYDVENMTDLTRALRKFKAGEESTITIWRSGVEMVLEVVFDEKPH